MLRICSLLVLMALPAAASTVTGVPRIVDGDTLVVQNTRVRLLGIDAPEAKQRCETATGAAWACGMAATATLRALVGQGVRCTGSEEDRYGRLIAVCRAGGRDVNAEMVARGAAFAYRKYSRDYVAQEQRARRAGLGIWQGAAERPRRSGPNRTGRRRREHARSRATFRTGGSSIICPECALMRPPGSARARASAGFVPKRRQKRPDGGVRGADLTRINAICSGAG